MCPPRDLSAIDNDQFARLADLPFLGTLRPDIGEGVRSMSLGSHIPYFRSESDTVTIARVLHARMVPEQHC
ncbi:MAG: type II toxin-antitoxin system RelE/ParE family toxin [Janthinobacterium lividum]